MYLTCTLSMHMHIDRIPVQHSVPVKMPPPVKVAPVVPAVSFAAIIHSQKVEQQQ